MAGPLAGCCTNANTRPAFVLGTGGVLPACGWVARLLSTTAEHTCYRVLGLGFGLRADTRATCSCLPLALQALHYCEQAAMMYAKAGQQPLASSTLDT